MTVREILENAHYNLCVARTSFNAGFGRGQLANVMKLLEEGKDLDDEAEEDD